MTSSHPTPCKPKFATTLFLLSLCVLCGNSSAQEFKTVHPGVEYAQVTHKLGNDPVKVNLLRLDLGRVRLDVHHAFDKAIGLEPTSAIALRHRAVAAINAGFFRLDKSEFAGDPAGVFMVDGELMSESSNDRTSISIQEFKGYSAIFFNRIIAYVDLQTGTPATLKQFQLSGINRSLNKDEAVLYRPSFGPSTLTGKTRFELAISKCKLSKLIGSFRDTVCKKFERVSGSANMMIPRDGFVLSIGTDYVSKERENLSTEIEALTKKRMPIRIRMPILLPGQFTTDKNVDITNGVPRLIRNGVVDITWEQEKASKSFAETRHPRTAVAKLKDGKFLMVTIDGRQPGISVGMTLQELADYLLSLGAIDAMNLDGGGSTTMFLDGKVVNTPSDKEGERKVSDAIVVTLRKKS